MAVSIFFTAPVFAHSLVLYNVNVLVVCIFIRENKAAQPVSVYSAGMNLHTYDIPICTELGGFVFCSVYKRCGETIFQILHGKIHVITKK